MKMKKIIFTILALSSIMTVTQAKENKMTKTFQSVPMNKVTIVQKGDAKAFCPNCGMTLSKFFKTNHSAVANGKPEQYCSIHCIVEDTQKGSKLTDIIFKSSFLQAFFNSSKYLYDSLQFK